MICLSDVRYVLTVTAPKHYVRTSFELPGASAVRRHGPKRKKRGPAIFCSAAQDSSNAPNSQPNYYSSYNILLRERLLQWRQLHHLNYCTGTRRGRCPHQLERGGANAVAIRRAGRERLRNCRPRRRNAADRREQTRRRRRRRDRLASRRRL